MTMHSQVAARIKEGYRVVVEFLATTKAGGRLRALGHERQERRRSRDKAWGQDEEMLEGDGDEEERNRETGARRVMKKRRRQEEDNDS